MTTKKSTYLIGTLYGIAAFGTWGILPMYWKLLKEVSSLEIIAHRIFWACVLVCLTLLAQGRWARLRQALSSRRNRLAILLGSVLITLNWFIYVWAVNTEHIVEASMGYYINPLFNVLLGVLILRERMNFWQYVAIALASIGVLFMTVGYGRVPWIALILTLTFGLYGLLKKTIAIDSLTSLGLETLFVSPFCLGFLFYRYMQGTGAFGGSTLSIHLLLIFAGVTTALPLFWFAQAAKMIPLSQLGFLQYLAPTLILSLGVVVYHEPFTQSHLISFGCIWTALIIYSLSQTAFMRNLQPAWFASRT